MKEEYYDLISSIGINDILKYIEILSYSKKYQIINQLLQKYTINAINHALNKFYLYYIKDKIFIESYRVKNLLIYYCKEYNDV